MKATTFTGKLPAAVSQFDGLKELANSNFNFYKIEVGESKSTYKEPGDRWIKATAQCGQRIGFLLTSLLYLQKRNNVNIVSSNKGINSITPFMLTKSNGVISVSPITAKAEKAEKAETEN